MHLIKAIASAGGAVICGLFGLVLCFGELILPHYRTIEISPGVFQEQWMSAREFWISVLVGAGLLILSLYLCRITYRIVRATHNVA
jgi:hypothetical protein